MCLAQSIAPGKPRDAAQGVAALERGDELDDRLLALAPHHIGSVLERLLDAEADV